MIYLDSAAQSPLKEEVLEVIIKEMKEHWYNPSSPYILGQDNRIKIEESRNVIKRKIHANKNDKLIFTSSGCESNTLAINCIGDEYTVLVDPLSHKSALYNSHSYMFELDNEGFIDASKLDKYLSTVLGRTLVSINGGNNEIGTIQKIKEISEVVHKHNGMLHVDAVQLFADQEINVNELSIDLMTISGHKIGTPSGIAALYARDGIELSPIIFGEQEFGIRGGTENYPYIIGFAKACELLDYKENDSLKILRNQFIKDLLTLPNSYLVGAKDLNNRLSNNINICFKNVDASSLINYLDLNDIYCSGGSACNSKTLEPSHVLKALSIEDKDLHSCVRFSLHNKITLDDLEKVFLVIKRFIVRLDNHRVNI